VQTGTAKNVKYHRIFWFVLHLTDHLLKLKQIAYEPIKSQKRKMSKGLFFFVLGKIRLLPLDVCTKPCRRNIHKLWAMRNFEFEVVVWIILQIFEQVSLLATGTCHTQFYMLYLCSLKPVLGEAFLSFLWDLVQSVSLAPYIRQTAVSYTASFLARAKFVRLGWVSITVFAHV